MLYQVRHVRSFSLCTDSSQELRDIYHFMFKQIDLYIFKAANYEYSYSLCRHYFDNKHNLISACTIISTATLHSTIYHTYTGNIWRVKISVNHIGKSYWWGKICRISYSQCICQIHFGVRICEEILVNSSWFTKFFPHQIAIACVQYLVILLYCNHAE